MVLRHQPRSQKADDCALQVTTTAQKAALGPLTPPVPPRDRSAAFIAHGGPHPTPDPKPALKRFKAKCASFQEMPGDAYRSSRADIEVSVGAVVESLTEWVMTGSDKSTLGIARQAPPSAPTTLTIALIICELHHM